jgi:segregation and condensation protein A
MDTTTFNKGNTGFKVETHVFEGPLDLLLHLIEREELDITKLALVQVTKPFLEYIHDLQEKQAEEVSSFLVIAARLMQIKSEALLPRPPEREPGEEDPSEELIQQLTIYKRYKEIASFLQYRESQGLRTYLRLSPPPKVESKLDMEGISLNDLLLAANAAFSLAEEMESVETVVRTPRVTIKEKIHFIKQEIKIKGRTSFQSLLGAQYTKVDVVVTFLALLELIKQFQIQVAQDKLFTDITIEPYDQWDEDIEDEDGINVEFIE